MASEYLRKKALEEAEKNEKKYGSSAYGGTTWLKQQLSGEKYTPSKEEDIAPVRTSSSYGSGTVPYAPGAQLAEQGEWDVLGNLEDSFNDFVDESVFGDGYQFGDVVSFLTAPEPENKPVGDKWYEGWLKGGAFSDGYQFGDLTRSVNATINDVTTNVNTAVFDATENLIDTVAFGVGAVGGLFDKGFREDVGDFIAKEVLAPEKMGKLLATYLAPSGHLNTTFNLTEYALEHGDEFFDDMIHGRIFDALNDVGSLTESESKSFFDEKVDNLVQSGSHLIGSYALSLTGMPAAVPMAVNAFGSETEQAFQNDATFDEAGISGVISAVAEVLFEKLSGGIKILKGTTLDEGVSKWLSQNISDKVVRTMAQYGINVAGEAGEEALTEIASSIGRKLTYMDEKEWDEVLSWAGIRDAAIAGGIMGGVAGGGKIANSAVTGKDYTSGLTSNEESVVKKIFDDEVARREANGEKVNKNKLWDEIIEKMNDGEISLDTIEEVLGGDDYKAYQDAVEIDNAAIKELEGLYKGDELKTRVDEILANSERNQAKDTLRNNVFELVKGDRLSESYAEVGRRGQKFEADLSKYDEKQSAIVQKAIDSGILNNTRRTHKFVDILAKIFADKGVSFDFINNEKLKASGFAVEGKTVNGFVTEDGITINVQSPKAWQTTVGHEITHVLEGTDMYNELQSVLENYAKSRKATGDFESEYHERLANAIDTYKGVKGYEGSQGLAKIKREVVADLVGDYLFQDADFVTHLSTKNRNLFQKLYDEIKYLYKVVKAGSKEARELEKVKKAFEDAYREIAEAGTKAGAKTKGIKYSMSGVKANTADDSMLAKAEQMLNEGVDSETVRQETGWYKGYDGQWRFEIDDSELEYYPNGRYDSPDVSRYRELSDKVSKREETEAEFEEFRSLYKSLEDWERSPYRLTDYINHKNLFEAYPQLKDVRLKLYDSKDLEALGIDESTGGYYDSTTNTIVLNKDWNDTEEKAKQTLIHEIQHAIQKIEGFASGASIEYWQNKRQDIADTIKGAKENLDLWLNDIGYSEFVKSSMQEVVKKEKTLDQHWEDCKEFKAKSKYAEQIAACEAELAEYQRLYDEVTHGMTAYEQYRNTAGEIEARDAESRLNLTAEQRRSNRPDIDNENVVFANSTKGFSYVGDTNDGRRVYRSDFGDDVSMDDRISEFKSRIATIFNLGAVELKTDVKKIRIKGDKFTEQKNLFGDKMAKPSEMDAKVSSLHDLADILATSKYDPSATAKEPSYENPSLKPKNKAHKDVKYWYKFRNEIVFDGVPYTVTFSIRDKGIEQYQYLIDFKENKTPGLSNTAVSSLLRADQVSYTNNIAPIPKNVKTQFSLSKYSLSDSDGKQLTKEQHEFFKDSKVRDENGNLKVMYHGSHEAFTVFDNKKARSSGYYGKGFYFTDSDSHAKQYGNTYEVYLNITNPLQDGTNDITKDQLRKFVEAIAEDEDYGLDNYGEGATVDSVANSVYGKGDFAMLMDINASCVGDMVAAIKLFNEVNGTDYNGIIAPTETVAFYPEQIKRVDNKAPTSDPDIRYSLSAETDKTYLDAVNRGDTETAQKLVDEAAQSSGYTIRAYHGSRSKFTVFDKSKGGQSNSEARLGFWFTETKTGAQNFADDTWYGENDEAQVYDAYLKLNNPKVYNSADNSVQIEKLREEKADIDREMSLFDSMYFFEDGRYYHTERYDYDHSKRRRVGIAEWDAFKSIVKKYDTDDVEYYLSQVSTEDRQAVKSDAERYLELADSGKKLGNQITELSYSDAYELFRTDIYRTIGKSAEDANIGGVGKYVENSAEMLQKYSDRLKAEGYDGIVIEGTEYDASVFGGKNNQYLVFEPNQIKSAEPITYDNSGNVIPLSERFNPDNKDIRYSLSNNGEQGKQYGNFYTPAKELMYDDIAPVAEDVNSPVENVDNNILPDDIAPMDETAEQERLDSLTNADAPMEEEAPYYEDAPVAPRDPFEDRDFKGVGKRNVNAFMYDNPEVKPLFQMQAKAMLGDLQSSVKGERWYNDDVYYESGGEYGWSGTERQTTDDIAYLLDMGYTYAQIEKGLNDIIEDNGAENNAMAKRIEFALNDRLSRGYTDINGVEIPPNQNYLNVLAQKQKAEAIEGQIPPHTDADVPDDFAPVKEQPTTEKSAQKETETEQQKVAKVKVNEETKTKKTIGQRVAEAYGNAKQTVNTAISTFGDKGWVFENLSKKHKNRKLEAKYNFLHYSESRAQEYIKNNLMPIVDRVKQTGKTEDVFNYVYHLHNIDRMSLETDEHRINREGLRENFKGLTDKQIESIAMEWIKKDTPDDVKKRIKLAREYIDANRAKNKAVFGESVTADVSREAVKKFETENPEFKEIGETIVEYNRQLRKMLVDGGVISQETADLWEKQYPHYVPIRREGKDGLGVTVPLDTNKTGVNAPIKRATGGDSNIEDLLETMVMRTEQTFKAVAKNNFGVELMHTLDSDSVQEKVSLDHILDSFASHEDLLQEGKKGQSPTFTVFEDGKRVTFEITKEMYDALKPTSENLAKTYKIPNKLSNLHRALLTDKNPVFLATNVIKDAQDVLFNSQHATRTYANFPRAIWQQASNGKLFQEYIANGGAQNTYFDSEAKSFKGETKGVRKWLNAISEANNFVERIPRLAEYMASRNSGRGIEESMLDAARVTTNFAAGADVTKFLNRNGFTFLNASVQGAMQNARNIREANTNGVKGWAVLAAKTIGVGLVPLVLNHLMWDDDEEYEELSDYVKQNYYIVAKTEDGRFIRIPKGRTMAVVQNAFVQMENLITGDDEVDIGNFAELVIANLAPNNPLENNILAPVIQTATNKTWYGDDLVPTRLQDVPEAEQFDETTDEFSKWLGEQTNFSPYKINYLLNQYSGGIGDVFLPMMTPKAEGNDDSFLGNLVAPWKDKFSTDPVMKNQNISDFYNKVDELTVNANASDATDEDILKSKYMNAVNSELAELYKQKREIQNSNLSDGEKYAEVRAIQEQINEIARNSLDSYGNVSIEGKYAKVGDVQFRWYEPGEDSEAEAGWKKLTEDQIAKQDKVTKGLGITPGEYWDNKEEYDFAYESPAKYAVAKSVGGYSAYKSYSSELYDIRADKDKYGNSISGSRKRKVIEYVNGLDVDYGIRLIIFKSEYNADDTYNYDIINYLNSRNDISYEEMEAILTELGFIVDSNGNIRW